MSNNESTSYFLWLDGSQQGPFSSSQLKQMWKTQRIASDTLTWREGWADWVPVGQAFSERQKTPPPKPEARDKKSTSSIPKAKLPKKLWIGIAGIVLFAAFASIAIFLTLSPAQILEQKLSLIVNKKFLIKEKQSLVFSELKMTDVRKSSSLTTPIEADIVGNILANSESMDFPRAATLNCKAGFKEKKWIILEIVLEQTSGYDVDKLNSAISQYNSLEFKAGIVEKLVRYALANGLNDRAQESADEFRKEVSETENQVESRKANKEIKESYLSKQIADLLNTELSK